MRNEVEYGIALATLSAKIGIHTRAGVAQLVEQLTCNQQVVGSTPIASSI